MKLQITPNVFATNKDEFMKRFDKIVPISKWIQIDFMDGKFVKNTSLAILEVPELQHYKTKFEAHLMMEEPWEFIGQLERKGFSKVLFHVETCKNNEQIKDTIMKIKLSNMLPGLVINPETPMNKLYPHLEDVDYVMFMGITPGAEGQEFKEEVYDKITELRNKNHEINIQVDGGVNDKTAGLLAHAGCNILNTGSFVGNADNPKKAMKELEEKYLKGLE